MTLLMRFLNEDWLIQFIIFLMIFVYAYQNHPIYKDVVAYTLLSMGTFGGPFVYMRAYSQSLVMCQASANLTAYSLTSGMSRVISEFGMAWPAKFFNIS
jgi:hypothetical protein